MKAGPKQQGQNKSFKVRDNDFHKSEASSPFWAFGCVEVAIKPEGIAVRDSKNRAEGILFFTHLEWACFLKGVANHEFDPIGGVESNLPQR